MGRASGSSPPFHLLTLYTSVARGQRKKQKLDKVYHGSRGGIFEEYMDKVIKMRAQCHFETSRKMQETLGERAPVQNLCLVLARGRANVFEV